jgi:predicted secreted protein
MAKSDKSTGNNAQDAGQGQAPEKRGQTEQPVSPRFSGAPVKLATPSANPQVGFLCVLTIGGVTCGKARDVDLKASNKKMEITTRSSAGWKEYLPGFNNWTCSIDQLFISDDAALVALESAYMNGTRVALSVADATGNGFNGNAIVKSIKMGQPLQGAVMLPVELKGTGPLTVL